MLKIEPHNSYVQVARNLALYWEKGYQDLYSTPTNYTGARDYFKKVLAITPDDYTALDNEGTALFHLGNHTALKLFDKAISLNSTDPDLYWDKAYALLIWHDYKGAVPAFAKYYN